MDVERTADLKARIAESPEDYQSYLDLADIYIKAKHFQDAYSYLSTLAKKLPEAVDVLTTASALAVKLEKFAEALEHLEKAAGICPNDRNIFHNIGLINATLERLPQAEAAFTKVVELSPDEAEGYNDLAVILAHAKKPDDAERAFRSALEKNPFFEKALENYCEFCLDQQRFENGLKSAKEFLDLVPESPRIAKWRDLFRDAISSGKTGATDDTVTSPDFITRNLKIAFFSTQESFASGILRHLSAHNEIRKFTGKTTEEIAELMRWADLAWFEWCDQLIIEATKLPKTCRIICRLHSYEAFTEMPAHVDWSKVDKLILVNQNVADVLSTYHSIPAEKTIIHNGVDTGKFTIPENKTYGKRVCSLGYINYKKNPALLLHCFKAIYDADPEFEFFIAGEHQDPRIKVYFDHMLERLNIPVHFQNWVDDVPAYLRDKDFVISTSLFESFHYSLAEGMASGVLPLVHAWPGSENIYPGEYLFDTPDECARLVMGLIASDRQQLAMDNRNYIEKRFSLDRQIDDFNSLIGSLRILPQTQNAQAPVKRAKLVPDHVEKSDVDYGKVSIVIPTFNRAEYLEEAIESALKQTYDNCEIIVCDDCSTDNTQTILDKYKDRITVLSHHRNRGVSAALNSCIRASSGDFISWLSSDDVYMPEKIEKQIEFLHKNPDIAMVYSDFHYIDRNSIKGEQANVQPLADGRETEELFERNPINGCSAMFKRECIDKVGWFDEGLGGRRGYTADGAMWHKLAHFYKIRFMNEPLLYYRLHDDNVANKIDTSKHWETYRGYMKTWQKEYKDNENLKQSRKPFANRPATKKGLKIAWIGVIDPGGISAMFKKAVERYTPHEMRIITHMESRGFDSDIVLKKTMWGGEQTLSDLSEARKVAEEADVLLFSAAVAPGVSQFDSRYFDTDDVPFGDINWKEYTQNKKCAVFFYGSTSIRRNYQWYLDLYRQKGWPIITCQPDIHRNMPGSVYTPILIDLENPRYNRDIAVGENITVIHSPTDRPLKNTDIYESIGRRISSEFPNVAFKLCENMGFAEAIALKREGSIAFDQLQIGDGYYCLSSVENSALGMINIVHLDEFGRKCIANSIGTNELPWYTPSTEQEVYEIIRDLVANPKRLEAEQKHTYDWFREWWHEKDLICHLTNFLENV
jgi:glycosyltransferase involved in cell wall biosynthesis/Tfp pilus assembly protein PilF